MSQVESDEIDLGELFASLWARKFLIVFVSAVSVALSVVYALTAPEEYQSRAVFELKSQKSGPSIPSQYGDIAALVGLGSIGGDSQGVFDRIAGRDFVIRLNGDVSLDRDVFFYDADADPGLISQVKDGLETAAAQLGVTILDATSAESVEDPLDHIFEVYGERVQVSETANGSIEVGVTHEDPARAAVIANAIVALVISELEAERRLQEREQLAYLSGEMARALAEADATKRAVADYALANSLTAQGEFTQRSQVMFQLREEARKTDEMRAAVAIIRDTLEARVRPSVADLDRLRREAPAVDDVEFRRLIGIPEALSAWRWPTPARLQSFEVTLDDRAARLARSLDELEVEAKLYADATETLAGLEREAKIAEATYNVLIEQVKAQALMAGYEAESATIYQSAVPAPNPVAPKKSLIVALGGVLGLFAGSALALLLATRRGVYYTRTSLESAVGAPISGRVPRLASTGGALPRAADRVLRLKSSDLAELAVDISQHAGSSVVVAATGRGLRAAPTALWAALSLSGSRATTPEGEASGVSLLVLGEALPRGLSPEAAPEGDLIIAKSSGITFYAPARGVSVSQAISGGSLQKILERARSDKSRLVVATSEPYAAATARALRADAPYLLAVTRPGRTLKAAVARVAGVAPWKASVSVG